MVAKGEVDIAKVRQKIKDTFKTDKEVEQVAEYYATAYAMSTSTAEDVEAIWEEVICDSLADMNVFSGSKMWAEAAEHMGMTIPAVQKAVSEGKANQTRGSPEAEGKASREIEAMENNRYSRLTKFRDDLPNVWFAYSYDYFYVYTNYSFSDYKVIKKIKINDTNSQLIDAIERRLRDDINGDTGTFDRWVKSFRSRKRLNNGNNVDASRGRTTGTVNGLDDSKPEGKSTNNSSKSNRDSELNGKASREIDTAYLDAVKSGDMETAQKMVDEAAKKAG